MKIFRLSYQTTSETTSKTSDSSMSPQKTRRSIPTSYDGRWEDIITSIVRSRGVDYLDTFIYAIPTLVAPMFKDRPETQKAILSIYNTYLLLSFINSCIKHWHNFLRSEIQKQNLCYSVSTPTQHYTHHLKDIITTLGPLRAYSLRSQERVIGRFKRYVKGKTKLDVSAGSILEHLA
ncbi:hypothetical protein K501DRAFT_228533, partial [Backusella circina FSU 941]